MNSEASMIFFGVLTLVITVGLTILLVLICHRREMQAIKIKSPILVGVSLAANIIFILQIFVIQLDQELCINSQKTAEADPAVENQFCRLKALQVCSVIFGFVSMALIEPLALISYLLRAVRFRRIF